MFEYLIECIYLSSFLKLDNNLPKTKMKIKVHDPQYTGSSPKNGYCAIMATESANITGHKYTRQRSNSDPQAIVEALNSENGEKGKTIFIHSLNSFFTGLQKRNSPAQTTDNTHSRYLFVLVLRVQEKVS